MRMLRSVVGWDGSASANEALDWAADREARRAGAVHLVLVLAVEGQEDAASRVTAARRSLQEATSALAGRLPALEVSAEIVIGDAAGHLARIAGRDSLLVVGAARDGADPAEGTGRVAVGVVDRPDGATAVVPARPTAGGTGVLAVVRGGRRSGGALSLAAQEAADLGEPLTVVRMRDPYTPAPDDAPGALDVGLAAVAHDFPALAVSVDRGWVRSAVSLLTRSERAALLVLEGHGPTAAPQRTTLERWLAGLARIPFVVVAEPVVRLRGQVVVSDTGSSPRVVGL